MGYVKDKVIEAMIDQTCSTSETVVRTREALSPVEVVLNPQTLAFECGNMKIVCPRNTGKGTRVYVDGIELGGVQRISFDLTPHDAVAVTLRLLPKVYRNADKAEEI